jgi:hypothetical protein
VSDITDHLQKPDQDSYSQKKIWNTPHVTVVCYKLTGEIGHSGNPDGGSIFTGGV